MEEHDLCGVVILVNQESMEHLVKFEASWSCARFFSDDHGCGVLVQTPGGIPVEEKRRMLEETVGMVLGQCHLLEEILGAFHKIKKMFGKNLKHVSHITRRL